MKKATPPPKSQNYPPRGPFKETTLQGKGHNLLNTSFNKIREDGPTTASSCIRALRHSYGRMAHRITRGDQGDLTRQTYPRRVRVLRTHTRRVCSTSSEITSMGKHNHTLGRQLLRSPRGAVAQRMEHPNGRYPEDLLLACGVSPRLSLKAKKRGAIACSVEEKDEQLRPEVRALHGKIRKLLF